jgi:CheY-like chemotaxis protein
VTRVRLDLAPNEPNAAGPAPDFARQHAAQHAPHDRPEGRRERRSQKILLAEDETHLRALLSITLSLEHYDVIEARGGAEALALAQAHHPDLVLLDVRMPNVDGLEVCRRIKTDPVLKDTPVVMVSALAMPDDRRAGRAAGADLYVTKPFSPQQLVEIVSRFLSASAS